MCWFRLVIVEMLLLTSCATEERVGYASARALPNPVLLGPTLRVGNGRAPEPKVVHHLLLESTLWTSEKTTHVSATITGTITETITKSQRYAADRFGYSLLAFLANNGPSRSAVRWIEPYRRTDVVHAKYIQLQTFDISNGGFAAEAIEMSLGSFLPDGTSALPPADLFHLEGEER
jgi:hypothetical protein